MGGRVGEVSKADTAVVGRVNRSTEDPTLSTIDTPVVKELGLQQQHPYPGTLLTYCISIALRYVHLSAMHERRRGGGIVTVACTSSQSVSPMKITIIIGLAHTHTASGIHCGELPEAVLTI